MSTALTVTPPNLTTWQPSPELWTTLTTGDKTIALADLRQTLAGECEASIRPLEILCEPVGEEALKAMCKPLVLVFGLGVQATAPAFWDVYVKALADLPRMAVQRALDDYTRDGKFFPKPAEIRERALPHADALRKALHRATEATKPVALPAPKAERFAPEEFERMQADLMQKLAAATEKMRPQFKHKPRPGYMPDVDEHGITPEMKAFRERNPVHY